jgi:hypothetical protein
MAIFTVAGAKVSIATGATATTPQVNAAGYDALTWQEIKEIDSIGQYGDASNDIAFTAIGDARVRHLKGSRDAGVLTLSMANDPLDAGQLALVAAEKTKFTYNFKIEWLDKADANDTNSIDYFGAKVQGVPKVGGSADDIVKREATLGIMTEITEVPATAVP